MVEGLYACHLLLTFILLIQVNEERKERIRLESVVRHFEKMVNKDFGFPDLDDPELFREDLN